jgi:hypothetical protein
MILTHEDDGCIHVYSSVEALSLEIEALDVEDCVRAIFDDAGQRYAIEWIVPNKRGLIGVTNGMYRLTPVGDLDPGGLLATLASVPRVYPEDDRAFVEALKVRLAAR